MTLLFGAIADDLTGGLELAAMLRAGGIACDFVTDPALLDAASGTDAAIVALRSRTAPRDEAVEEFRGAALRLRELGARQLFFKYCATFDSTDDGNIGPCADLLRELTQAEQTLFCPSFPEAGRRVFQGHLFADDQLISESPKRHDPLTPMTDPNLVRVLQRQTATPVGLLPEQIVRAGLEAMQVWSGRQIAAGIPFAIADATLPEDLDRLAELTAGWPLMTGNSSICAYYPRYWRAQGLTAPSRAWSGLPGVAGPGIVLAGSCAERTLRQLEAFGLERPVRFVDILSSSGEDEIVDDLVAWALPRLREGPVAIATSARPEVVRDIQAKLGRRAAADRAELILGKLATRLYQAGVRRFLIAGGETSGSVLDHLGVRELQVGAYEAPGISHAVSRGADPSAFCLKSGKLGPEGMLLPMLDRMESGER